MTFLLRRFAHALFLLAGVPLLSFVLFDLAPGNYVDELLANPQVSRATVETYRRDLALDAPLHERYVRWAAAAVRGDLGRSFTYQVPVLQLLVAKGGATMLLSASALLLTWLTAVPLATWSAARPRTAIATGSRAAAGILMSLPDVIVALAFLVVAVRTGWFKVSGSFPLAVLACALLAFPAVFRHSRRSVADHLRTPFAEHLRACGVSEVRILFGHVLPAASGPLIALLGLSAAALLSSSLIVEVVLGWPGLGPLLLEAILARDVPLVVGNILFATALLVVAGFASDVALYAADPRIRRDGR
jgi:peptide/nickel transport system permease protein